MRDRYAIPSFAIVVTIAVSGIALAAHHNVAVAGTTCAANIACASASNIGAGAAFIGTSASGPGVAGQSAGDSHAAGIAGIATGGGSGVAAASLTGPGIEGRSVASAGIFARSTGAQAAVSAMALGRPGGVGMEAVDAGGTAIRSIGPQAFAGIGTFASRGTGSLFRLFDSQGSLVLAVDQMGDLYLSGFFLECSRAYDSSNGSCAASKKRSTNTRRGDATIHYVRRGEARLVAGSARVAFDPALARTLGTSPRYHIFFDPPDAGSHPNALATWLYVAGRSASGFTVRAHGTARAGLTFGYRIVADIAPSSGVSER